ncbi:DUF6093 family protein [Micromonospora deserti]|uniref:Head-to-tail stopper n=1 Tax=Micromonospora deserti TaxID=2070366 RepID=A0A2W2DEH8_9ACTN|nr:DUF6093 family protein [Micromonospora deserti]PZF98257.1 hypothetical protein C1I99_13810 [Micromonospora deserti]
MSAGSVLQRGRRAAERLMVDTCLIRRVTGTSTDPDTGQITPTFSTVYSGKCRVQQATANPGDTTTGDAELLMVPRVLWLPVASSPDVRAGDRVEMTASVYDPDLTGRRFVVRGEFAKSHATARRLGIEEVTS